VRGKVSVDMEGNPTTDYTGHISSDSLLGLSFFSSAINLYNPTCKIVFTKAGIFYNPK
jgi:hypothetical protein